MVNIEDWQASVLITHAEPVDVRVDLLHYLERAYPLLPELVTVTF